MYFSGSIVAIVTPWTDDLSRIDYGQLEELVEMQIAGGTDGILPAGTTGESPTLTHQEQGELIGRLVKLVKGRCKVVAGAGSNSTQESVSLAKHAKDAGADALMMITPYYNRPTPEGLYRHFATVAEACDLPTLLYNIPSRTGVNMLPDTIIRLNRDYPNICGVKEASGSVDQSSQIIAQSSMDVMSGDDSLCLPIMAVGGTGVVSVIANIAPAETKALTVAAAAGDFVKAREIHYQLLPIMKACFVETNPGPVKAALRLMGKGNGSLRLPMVAPKPENEKILLDALRKVGLVK